jgi:hypothetical protein
MRGQRYYQHNNKVGKYLFHKHWFNGLNNSTHKEKDLNSTQLLKKLIAVSVGSIQLDDG